MANGATLTPKNRMENLMRPRQIVLALGISMAPSYALAQSVSHEAAARSVAELGYLLSVSAPEAAVTLEGPSGETWTLPQRDTGFDLRFNGPADHTGDNVPELIVIERTKRSAGTVHVIELGPDGPRALLQRSASNAEMTAFENLAPGDSLAILASDTMKAEPEPRQTAAQRMGELGYTIEREGTDTLQILRNGKPVHSVQSFSIRLHGPAYMSESDDPGVLILSANSRSFSDLVLVELTEDGAEVRFSENGFTRDMTGLFTEAIDRVEAGQPALHSVRPGPIERPEIPDLKLRD